MRFKAMGEMKIKKSQRLNIFCEACAQTIFQREKEEQESWGGV
jgi:hypothetical protein